MKLFFMVIQFTKAFISKDNVKIQDNQLALFNILTHRWFNHERDHLLLLSAARILNHYKKLINKYLHEKDKQQHEIWIVDGQQTRQNP